MGEQFENMVIDLLESIGNGGENAIFANIDKINTIAEYSRSVPIYHASFEECKKTFEDMTPQEIYNHMITKIVNSPTILHRDAAVILTVPHLVDSINRILQEE